MSEVKITGLTRIDIQEGDYLYVQYPCGLDKETQKNIVDSIGHFFEGKLVKVISGDIDLKFTAVKPNDR